MLINKPVQTTIKEAKGLCIPCSGTCTSMATTIR